MGVWAYMVASALLSAEVADHASCALGRPGGVSLLSQARLTLGPIGAAFASLSYVFLHFAVSFATACSTASRESMMLPRSQLLRFVLLCRGLTFECTQVLVAYVSQGAAIGTRIIPGLPTPVAGGLFLGSLSLALYILNDEQVDTMYVVGVDECFGQKLSQLIPPTCFGANTG